MLKITRNQTFFEIFLKNLQKKSFKTINKDVDNDYLFV